ncbi:unnamed protein product [Urochloa humidicola]
MKCFFVPCLRRHTHRHRVDPSSSPSCSSGTARKFTLAQLSAATGGFRDSNLIGEGGFGRVYRGCLDGHTSDVAVKKLRHGGAQGKREFLVECTMLTLLHHPNLVSLVGYCAHAHDRLLVYEFLPRGSLDAHLFPSSSAAGNGHNHHHQLLGWDARVNVAVGVARGLRYLHEAVTPPVIYRDMKPSNILLAEDLSPKLSDLGLAKLGPVGDATHVSTRVMGTYGYCAPDYAITGKLSVKSDVYSFGVVLLELLTGRRAFDSGREDEQWLLAWARSYLQQLQQGRRSREAAKCLETLADPALQGRYPRRGMYQVAVVASLCLHDKPNLRPTMSDVTKALEHVASQPWCGGTGGSVDKDQKLQHIGS